MLYFGDSPHFLPKHKSCDALIFSWPKERKPKICKKVFQTLSGSSCSFPFLLLQRGVPIEKINDFSARLQKALIPIGRKLSTVEVFYTRQGYKPFFYKAVTKFA